MQETGTSTKLTQKYINYSVWVTDMKFCVNQDEILCFWYDSVSSYKKCSKPDQLSAYITMSEIEMDSFISVYDTPRDEIIAPAPQKKAITTTTTTTCTGHSKKHPM